MKVFENDFTVKATPIIEAEEVIENSVKEAPVVEPIPEPVVVTPAKVEVKKVEVVAAPAKKFKKVTIETDCGLKVIEVEVK